MKRQFKGFGKIIKETYKGWSYDDPFRQSAVIAYYAIFSLPALLVLIINVLGFFFEKETIHNEISRQIADVMGANTAKQVSDIVEKAGDMKAGVLSTIIAVATIIFGATGVFVQLQKSLNQIWDVKERDDLSFIKKLRGRLFSLGFILSVGFLLLVSLVVSTFLAAASNWLLQIFPDIITYLFYVIEFAVSISVISLIFALMFKYLPDVKIRWRNVWIGAFLTSTLFILGKYGLSIYFGKAHPASVYGVAGSIILLLLWVSYSSMIVFFGAEFTKQYAIFHGLKIAPSKNAIKTDKNIDEQHRTKKTENLKGMEPANKYGFAKKDHSKATHHNDNYHGNGRSQSPLMGTSERNKKDDKTKTIKMKSRKELLQKIEQMEKRVVIDKKLIKDDFKPSHLLGGLFSGALKLKNNVKPGMTFQDVIKGVAREHIAPVKARETILDKVKRFIHLS